MNRTDSTGFALSKDGYAFFLFTPLLGGVSPIGLSDKYVSFLCQESVIAGEESLSLTLKQGGIFTFYSEKPVSALLVNGSDRTASLSSWDGLYEVELEGSEKLSLTIICK